MILIDSLYINNSGGLRLLEYLVSSLQEHKIDFYLLADSRCLGKFDHCKYVKYMKPSLLRRRKFYKKNRDYSSVLCFGNIPAPIGMDCPVYTYFHNINLLTLKEARNLKEKVLMWLKREVFRFYKGNTDYWLVQTQVVKDELSYNLKEPVKKIKLLPFFELPLELKDLASSQHGSDYVFVSNYTGAKGHEKLLEAWSLLHEKGINRRLHLTVPFEIDHFIDKVAQAQKKGVNVINHGFVSFEKVMELYKLSRALVFPSHNESLGLGIIEGITAGCDVIGSDLPYIYAVCEPSEVFNPHSAESIAEAIIRYEKNSVASKLCVTNGIGDMIALLKKEN